MTAADHLVLIVDDDHSVREALQELLAAAGLCSVALGSAAEVIGYPRPEVLACLILDVELPDINGLDLQRQIGDGYHPPIIFVTGHGDIPSSVRAIKAGALDFLTKPFRDEELLTLVHAALAQDRERRAKYAELKRLRRCFEALTPREREVLPLVVKRPSQQAGSCAARYQRSHLADPSHPRDAENGGRFACRPGENGWPAGHTRLARPPHVEHTHPLRLRPQRCRLSSPRSQATRWSTEGR